MAVHRVDARLVPPSDVADFDAQRRRDPLTLVGARSVTSGYNCLDDLGLKFRFGHQLLGRDLSVFHPHMNVLHDELPFRPSVSDKTGWLE